MAIIKKLKAIKKEQNHLLGIQDLSFSEVSNILNQAKKNNIVAGIHNATPEYAKKMINIGFQLVSVGSDKIFMSDGAKSIVNKIKN